MVYKRKFPNGDTKYFIEGRIFTQLICKGDKKFMATILQKYKVNCHTYLQHIGMYLNEATFSQQ